MGGPVGTYGQSAVGGDDLDVQLGIGHCHPDLLPTPSAGEHSEGGGECGLAGYGEACGHPDHVGFRDTDLDEPLGGDLLEIACLGGSCKVGIHDDVLVLLRQIGQCLPVVRALCEFLACHCITALSSSTAFAYSSGLQDLPWKSTLFSMKDTPFPLMVFMMITVGFFLDLAALSQASMI